MDRTYDRPERQRRGRRHQPGGVHRDEHQEPRPEFGNFRQHVRTEPRSKRRRARKIGFQRLRPEP